MLIGLYTDPIHHLQDSKQKGARRPPRLASLRGGFERVKKASFYTGDFWQAKKAIAGAFPERVSFAMAANDSGAAPQASPPDPLAAAPGASAKTQERTNDPAKTGFDPQMKWWMNYFNILTGQMTPEGQFHFREWRYTVHEERDCKKCEEYRDWLFTYSPTVNFLSGKIQDLNGKLDKSNVLCRRCPARLTEDGQVHRQSGGFSPDHGILLCANEIRDRKHLEDTLAHEMVHAWDHLRWKVDWMGDKDLKHAACTEVSNTLLIEVCTYLD